MPAMPVCHGRLYSLFLFHEAFLRSSRTLTALGILSSGSFWAHPSCTQRDAIQNVGATMSGAIFSPLASNGCTLAKYSLLSLYASVYFMAMPVAFWNSATVASSM